MSGAKPESTLRHALAINPASGIDWWTLANLKGVELSDRDVNAMTVALATPMLSEGDQKHLHFALAKVLGDRGDDETARRHRALGEKIGG